MYSRIFRIAAGSVVYSTIACWAATLTVGKPNTPCTTPQYSTISAALTAAHPGETIEVCPAFYDEQLLITKPVTLRGIEANGVGRVLLQPAAISPMGGLSSAAVITVMNTFDVVLENLAIDASRNTVQGCDTVLAGVHFFNASGTIQQSAVFGAKVANPQSCSPLPRLLLFGSGQGIQIDGDGAGPYHVVVNENSIHDYTRNGVLAVGSAVTAEVRDNTISGIGPAVGVFQFGVFIANGAAGRIRGNVITEGLCGSLTLDACIAARSEGVTLRAAGPGTTVEDNVITNAQSGIFVNGGENIRITNNQIRNIEGLNGIDIQGSATGSFTGSMIAQNVIANVGPITQSCSENGTCCGIFEDPGTGVSGNRIVKTTVNDALCGVAYVPGDLVVAGRYYNTLYPELNISLYPTMLPPAKEPNQ